MARPSTRRTAVVRGQRQTYSRVVAAHALAALRHQRTWFAPPTRPLSMVRMTKADVARIFDVPVELVDEGAYPTEHWADTELHRPVSSLNHRTARFCGKPYHWRQDYTGQLKLAAGESPWT